MLIGDGLFSNLPYLPAAHIIDYVGEVITVEESILRDAVGRGGFMIKLSESELLDCYASCSANQCKASKAKCATGLFNTKNRCAATSNASIRVSKLNVTWRVRLVASKAIPAHKEILTTYGRFPIHR